MAVGACMGNENKSSTPFVSSLMNDQKYFLYCFNIRKRGWNNNKSYIRLVEPNLDVFQLFHPILIIKLRDCRGKIVFRRTFCSYCEEKKMIFLNVMTKTLLQMPPHWSSSHLTCYEAFLGGISVAKAASCLFSLVIFKSRFLHFSFSHNKKKNLIMTDLRKNTWNVFLPQRSVFSRCRYLLFRFCQNKRQKKSPSCSFNPLFFFFFHHFRFFRRHEKLEIAFATFSFVALCRPTQEWIQGPVLKYFN